MDSKDFYKNVIDENSFVVRLYLSNKSGNYNFDWSYLIKDGESYNVYLSYGCNITNNATLDIHGLCLASDIFSDSNIYRLNPNSSYLNLPIICSIGGNRYSEFASLSVQRALRYSEPIFINRRPNNSFFIGYVSLFNSCATIRDSNTSLGILNMYFVKINNLD
jgi:hypothetical protein